MHAELAPERPLDFATLWTTLRRGAAGALAVQVGGAVLALLVHVIIAHLLGKGGYGNYSLALTWVNVLTVLALLGQSSSVVRFIPRYIHHGRWGSLRGLRRGTTAIITVTGVAIALVGAFGLYVLRAHIERQLLLTMLAAFLLLPIVAQLLLSGALHCGLKRATSSGLFNSVLRPLLLLGCIAFLIAALHIKLTAPIAMVASCVAALGALAFSEIALSRAWPPESRKAKPKYEIRPWLDLGRQLFLLAAIGVVLNRVDVLILGAYAPAAEVGPYYAAVQLGTLAVYGLNAVNTILAPLIAERYTAGDHDGLASLVHRAAWLTFAITIALSVCVVVAGKWVLGLFGPGFEAAYIPLIIILGGQCVNAATGPVGYLMTMTRFERTAPILFGGGAIINIAASVMLIPYLGMLGAAIATAASTIAWNLAAFVFIWKKLRVNPSILRLAVS